MDYFQLKKEVKKEISPKKFNHTLGVVEMAEELGRKYQIDIEKLKIAALLHDISKESSNNYLQEICENNFFHELSEKDIQQVEILHSYVGSFIAKEKYGIIDVDILNSIKYHTTGKKGLNLFGRIIYIADAIEKNRNYSEVHKIREIVKKDIDLGIIYEINYKISYLVNKNHHIHDNTIQMKDWLIEMKGLKGDENEF